MQELKSLSEIFVEIGINVDKLTSTFLEINYDISTLLVDYRTSHNMNQSQLGKLLGVSRHTISKYENGDYNFTLSQLCKICDLLQYDIVIKRKPTEF